MILWAFQPLDELDNKTGFVDCPDKTLAKSLLAAEKVQDPQIGGRLLKYIQKVADVVPEPPDPEPDPEPEPPNGGEG